MTLYWVNQRNQRIDFMTFDGSLKSVRKQAKKLARNRMFHAINADAIRIDICESGIFGKVLESVTIER